MSWACSWRMSQLCHLINIMVVIIICNITLIMALHVTLPAADNRHLEPSELAERSLHYACSGSVVR